MGHRAVVSGREEGVEDPDSVPGVEQGVDDVRADEAGAAGDEDHRPNVILTNVDDSADRPSYEKPGRPSPGPEQVHPHDRALVEWVATASPGDRIPEPWKWASSPTQSVILRLIDLRVIPVPAAGTDRAEVVRDAAAAARAWLEAHPRDEGSGPAAEASAPPA